MVEPSSNINEPLIISLSIVTTLLLLVVLVNILVVMFVLLLRKRSRKNKREQDTHIHSNINPSYQVMALTDNAAYSSSAGGNPSNESATYETIDEISTDKATTGAT